MKLRLCGMWKVVERPNNASAITLVSLLFSLSQSQFILFLCSEYTDGCLDVEWLEGDFFVSCGSDRSIFVECIGETVPVAKLQGHTDEINQLKYEPEHKLLASGSDDYTACIWKVDDFTKSMLESPADGVVKPRPDVRSCTHRLRGHEGEVANIAWQPKGDRETYDPVLVTYALCHPNIPRIILTMFC